VRDGVTGRLVRPGAIDAFAEALAGYCADPTTRAAAGRAGIAASARYGWDEVNQALVEGYIRVIRQRAAGGSLPPRSPVP
jgi:glycosyltransferase involved in cell wall biosynthesis